MSRWLLSPLMIRFVFFVERWVLSAAFLFLGYEYISTLQLMDLVAHSRNVMPAAAVARDAGFSDGVHFEDFARYSLLAGSNIICGLLLLISRKPSRYPTTAPQVVVPLVATFSYMLFNQNAPLPAWLTTPFIPTSWGTSLAAAGVVFSVFGALFSLWSILWLGRSLGIVVSVREIVLVGPYRYVRHPIYLGYGFLFLGLFLTACTVRMTLLAGGAFALLWWRARLEEAVLSAHSPAYREWMAHTGFLWPVWHGWTGRMVADPPHELTPVVPLHSARK